MTVWYSLLFKSFPQFAMSHIVKGFYSTRNPDSQSILFSEGLSFFVVVVIWFGWLVVGCVCVCVCVCVCSSILAKKQLSKDEQSLGAKITALLSSSTIIASQNSDTCLYFLLKGLHLSIMKFSGLDQRNRDRFFSGIPLLSL